MKFLDRFMALNSKRRYKKIFPYIDGERVLDVGCAEGWGGHYLNKEKGVDVSLVDVININKTSLNFSLYDGQNLPFEDSSFDCVLILLTLHHCENPIKTLQEAMRVSKKRLVITESLYHTKIGEKVLTYMDGGFNGLRSQNEISKALHFKTHQQWLEEFDSLNLNLIEQKWLSRGLHNQKLYILDK